MRWFRWFYKKPSSVRTEKGKRHCHLTIKPFPSALLRNKDNKGKDENQACVHLAFVSKLLCKVKKYKSEIQIFFKKFIENQRLPAPGRIYEMHRDGPFRGLY